MSLQKASENSSERFESVRDTVSRSVFGAIGRESRRSVSRNEPPKKRPSTMNAVLERGLSLEVEDNLEATLTLESSRWRGRSIGFGMERCHSEDCMTVSMRFTASELDLVGMGLSRIPVSPSRQKVRAP